MSSSYSSQRGKPAASPLGAGLSDETRKAMNSAFDAMSDWRNDLSTITDKNSTAVFDKMGAAAKAMGWPSDFVDMTRQQMQSASKMQMQMMDQLMDVWEQQMKSPGSPISMPKMGGTGGFPDLEAGIARSERLKGASQRGVRHATGGGHRLQQSGVVGKHGCREVGDPATDDLFGLRFTVFGDHHGDQRLVVDLFRRAQAQAAFPLLSGEVFIGAQIGGLDLARVVKHRTGPDGQTEP